MLFRPHERITAIAPTFPGSLVGSGVEDREGAIYGGRVVGSRTPRWSGRLTRVLKRRVINGWVPLFPDGLRWQQEGWAGRMIVEQGLLGGWAWASNEQLEG